MNHSSYKTRYLQLTCLLLLSLLLLACGETTAETDPPSQPVVPPGTPTGSLQVTVQGLPDGADASVLIAGPEDYSATVTGSQTLQNLRTGSYTLEAETIEYRDATYSGTFSNNQTETSVNVTEDDTATIEVTYTSVGSVEEGEIAPGTVREGLVAENAFDDYTFQGQTNVPLTFDFTGTGEENRGRYSVALFNQDNLDEPLYTSFTISTFGQPLLIGFSPPEDGTYVLRVRGELDVVDYRVRAQYLSGPPKERQELTVLNYGDTATGAVTFGSFDSYRFTGTANEPVLLTFSYDLEDSRYRGNYQVEFYRVGQEEPLETSFTYSNFAPPPEVDFTPQEDGDYLIRVLGTGTVGTSLVRYSFALERLE